LIIVDDGSTDGTENILGELVRKDQRLRVIRQKNSGTAGGARNSGLKVATGDYICFLDGDDTYHQDKLLEEATLLDQFPTLGLVFHDLKLINQDGDALNGTYLGNCRYLDQAGDALTQIGNGLYRSTPAFYPFMSSGITGIHTSSIMVRRSVLNEESILFDPSQPIGEDIDLWFRLAARCEVSYIDRPLSNYRQHPASVTRNLERLAAGFIFAHSRNLDRAKHRLSKMQADLCKRKLASQWFELGYQRRINGARCKAIEAHIHSLFIFPSSKTLLDLLKAIFSMSPNT